MQIDEARKQDGPGGGGRKARDSGKNEQHGDGGKALEKVRKQLEELDRKIAAATGRERHFLIQTRKK